MSIHDYPVYVFLLGGSALSIIGRKLTVAGAITGALVGLLVFKGAGYTGIAMLALFFIAGSGATAWQVSKKQQLGVAESNKGKRTMGQVLANGGIAAILGAMAWLLPQQNVLMQVMIASSLAAATADTLASELGSIYGRRFFDIITLKKSPPGPNGVVSIEGTLIGIAGAALIALVYALGFGFNQLFFIIIIAGAVGNLSDSVLGATLERRNLIGNNLVNFLNTGIGALICYLITSGH